MPASRSRRSRPVEAWLPGLPGCVSRMGNTGRNVTVLHGTEKPPEGPMRNHPDAPLSGRRCERCVGAIRTMLQRGRRAVRAQGLAALFTAGAFTAAVATATHVAVDAVAATGDPGMTPMTIVVEPHETSRSLSPALQGASVDVFYQNALGLWDPHNDAPTADAADKMRRAGVGLLRFLEVARPTCTTGNVRSDQPRTGSVRPTA